MMRYACLALVLAGCSGAARTASVEQAIIGGVTDDGDPAVMLIQAHVPGSNEAHLCSGSLVSPHVILTAAHCVDPATVGDGATFLVFGATVASAASQSLAVSETHYDTQFNPDKDVFPKAGHDIGVVILKDPSAVTPVRYNHAPVPTSLVGAAARIVGYGVTDESDSNASTAGTRRQAPTLLSSVNDVLLGFTDGQHVICEGDSGGPAFMTVAGVDTVAGLTAFGEASCAPTTTGNDTRVDTWAAFVDGYVRQFDPPAISNLATGTACSNDLECAFGICAQIGATSFCSAACEPGSASSCPTGMVCASLDDDLLCAPSSLAMAAHSGCDIGGAVELNCIQFFWLGALLLLLLRRARRRFAQ